MPLGKLDSTADAIRARLESALRVVNRRIAAGIPDKLDAAAALRARLHIAQAMAVYDKTVDAVLPEYAKAAQAAGRAWGLGEQLDQNEAALITAMIHDTAAELKAAGMQKAGEISDAVYVAAVAGSPKEDLLAQVEQLLIGGTDKRGRSLAGYAGTVAETRYMQTFAASTKLLADKAGVDRFEYVGSLVRDSRPWCREHVGKVFTRAEIEEWRDADWAGKAPGDPFIVRGGWNCRHHWQPVKS